MYGYNVAMHIDVVPNRGARPAYLLRESYREGGRVHKRTLANLSALSDEQILAIRAVLRGEQLGPVAERFEVIASRAHGHVQAVRVAMRRLGFESLLASRPSRQRDRVAAMVAARIVAPHTKLATTRWWHTTTLAEDFGVADADEDELYAAMDWLLARQDTIEKKLAARHLDAGGLVLYDLSSSYFEGSTCPLAKLGYSRDGRKGTLQVNYGLLTDARGCPVAISVHEGNVADSLTLLPALKRLRQDFGIERLVMVGDRGMISQKAIDEMRNADGIGWITALKSASIRALVEQGHLQLGLFDERNLVELGSPDYPGERLVACRNPELAKLRAHKREELLVATERSLDQIKVRVGAGKLAGADAIGLRVGKVVNQYKVAKHFELAIGEHSFSFARKHDGIAAEAALDGIYVVRTSLPKKALDNAATVGAYKSLAQVERAFRSLKTVDIHLRPIFHWTAPRVRAHVFLCMLAYHVEHHMRAKLAPMLYDETDHEAAAAMRASIVAKAERSDAAKRKQTTGRTDDGLPVHSFQSLLADLATYCRIQATTALNEKYVLTLHTRPTPIHSRAFELLAINPDRTQ